MRTINKLLFCMCLAVLCLVGCGTTHYVSLEPEANKMWVGKPHSAIIETYGAPTREISDGEDGIILIYEETHTVTNTYASPTPMYMGVYGFYYHVMTPTDYRTESHTETDYAHFYISGKGKCYKVVTNLEREMTEEEVKAEEAKNR